MADTKSRQSSAGKSFFSRSNKKDKDKDKRNPSDESKYLGGDLEKAGSAGSRTSSRHTRNSSVASLERPDSPGADLRGINMMAGVITSIPYDTVTADSKSPIPVDYLPRNDQIPVRRDTREPLPHHLNQGGGDFHQYDSYSTNQSSAYGRSSFDQSSIDSSTERSSIFSSASSSKTAMQTPYSNNLSPSHATHRESHRLTKFPHHHVSGFNSPSSSGQGQDAFNMNKPTDDRVVEEMFLALMQKRGWHNLPDQARRQMMAYPPAKKWTLVHQDRLTEWQGEQKRRTTTKTPGQYGSAMDMLANAEEEGTPEWFVKKVMDNSISAKQLQSLAVSLRTQPIGWVKTFVECQGQVALTNVLGKINRRQAQGPAPADGSTSEKDLDREYDIVKCLKALMNNKYGATMR
ncbi:Cytokinesis protein sepA [Lachnellula cervina]|uniref:Cytokinesis protein sepA n=1 Tax=Lachnellula cervina TaxID=1316786 RepID=A0A7D8UM88_9HELO|nr:Cytokinesis protein sepA [Lachnellula cervina]